MKRVYQRFTEAPITCPEPPSGGSLSRLAPLYFHPRVTSLRYTHVRRGFTVLLRAWHMVDVDRWHSSGYYTFALPMYLWLQLRWRMKRPQPRSEYRALPRAWMHSARKP